MSEELFSYTLQADQGSHRILELKGDLSGMAVVDNTEALVGELANAKSKLVFNMTQVTYIDSCAIGLIMKVAKSALPLNKELILLSPNANVMRVLSIVNLHKAIQIVDTF
ncbi:MAG: anti-anti-sigma factor [Candidatus Omnitrophota bacterium]|jgi:anti-anti-sigma factor